MNRTLIAGLAVAAGAAAWAADPAVVVQPRPFGHVVGDVLTQRVLLEVAGRPFTPASLPQAERLGVWLERRPSRIEAGADGRRWLVVDYQVINAPQMLRSVSVPAWALQPAEGAAALQVGEWPISIAPLTPRTAFAAGELLDVRPDRPAPAIATQPMRSALRLWSGALAVTLGAWLAWLAWRNRQAAAAQPFARALRELRGLDDGDAAAWQALHHAFDHTAGRVVQRATLPQLFQRAPQLEPLRERIEQFYAQSQQRFFGSEPLAAPMPLRALCAALRRVEKRHER
jgi:mxaA protein